MALKLARLLLALAPLCALAHAQSSVVPVDAVDRADLLRRADAAVSQLSENLAHLSQDARALRARAGRHHPHLPVILPVNVQTPRAQQMGGGGGGRAPGDIVLQFDTTGPNAFTQDQVAFLQGVYAAAKPFMDAAFGSASQGGVVRVSNWSETLPDRPTVAGGYYLPDNGQNQREIRFVYYNSEAARAVNFIHTLLLAYQSPTYQYDAFQEGLVRAATMRIVRQPTAVPMVPQDKVEEVLENTYDAGPFYDWYNGRALGGSRFIAPNLWQGPLPISGSVGGLYLLRYQMAGSAWQKVIAEHPTFIAQFNAAFYQNPLIRGDVPALVQLGQQVLNSIRPSDPTVEGLPFADWFRRQHILTTYDTPGLKLLLEPLPITSELAGQDFGVFLIQAHFFDTQMDGTENLLSGTSFPIFWDPSFFRMSPDAQSERMRIAGAYGAVAPNFENLNAGKPYLVTVDVPIQDQVGRAFLPAGAIATAQKPTPNDFYGTVVGARPPAGHSYVVRLTIGSEVVDNIPVTAGAFGANVGTANFRGARSLVVEVRQIAPSGAQTVFTRRVNKGQGPLAVDLRIGADTTLQMGSLPPGINLVGFPVEPYSSHAPSILGLDPALTQIGRYDSSRARYRLYPDVEPFKIGHGYFVRVPASTPLAVPGRVSSGMPWAVALRPGWNLVANPLAADVPVSQIQVVRGSGFPKTFQQSLGEDLGIDFFGFVRGPADAFSGVPEVGSFSVGTTFQTGRAYFVRCLAPEGATLLFSPNPVMIPMSAGGRGSAPQEPRWLLRPRVFDGTHSAFAFLAADVGATPVFDVREDSGLPPSMGGLQISSINGEALFRDVRPVSTSETYTMRVDGLTPGKRYVVFFDQLRGRTGTLAVRPERTNRFVRLRANGHHTFTATQPTYRFDLLVRGRG
jgi:hypothetical protein